MLSIPDTHTPSISCRYSGFMKAVLVSVSWKSNIKSVEANTLKTKRILTYNSNFEDTLRCRLPFSTEIDNSKLSLGNLMPTNKTVHTEAKSLPDGPSLSTLYSTQLGAIFLATCRTSHATQCLILLF